MTEYRTCANERCGRVFARPTIGRPPIVCSEMCRKAYHAAFMRAWRSKEKDRIKAMEHVLHEHGLRVAG